MKLYTYIYWKKWTKANWLCHQAPKKFLYDMCIWNWSFWFFQIVLTILRPKLESLTFKIIRYRTYKQFEDEEFKAVFQKYWNRMNSRDLSVNVFKVLFLNALNKSETDRKKYPGTKHSSFFNKELSKVLVPWRKLRKLDWLKKKHMCNDSP